MSREDERLREFEEAMDRINELLISNIKELWIEYDRHNDILYINFGVDEAEESIMVDDDIIVGLKDRRIVGITIFNFSRRVGAEICA